jgi:hypothetical protein
MTSRPAAKVIVTANVNRRTIMQEEGYSGIFYVMLIIGIVGVLGFFVVEADAGLGG